jgi:hypothetical protein
MFRVRSHVTQDGYAYEGMDHRGGTIDPDLPRAVELAQQPAVFGGNPRLVVSTDGKALAGTPAANGIERATALTSPITLIGRGQDTDLRLSDPGVSRHHARVTLRDDAAWVEDLGSTNGTTVDGVPVTSPTSIGSGQRLTIGSTVLIFLRDPGGS